MKKGLLILVLTVIAAQIHAQSATDFFNRAANEYIYKNDQIALNTLNTGLSKYPGNRDLENLKEKIEKEKEEQEQKQQQQQEQEQKNQEEQQEQNQDQQQEQNQEEQQQEEEGEQSEDDENAEEKEQEGQGEQQDTEEDGKETDQPPQMSRSEKLEEMNLSEEKAMMILDAMKNSEIQYIQQNKRNPTKKPDADKPDW